MTSSDQPAHESTAADPQRPRYHFMPPANWLNDPNGLIHWKGLYHLFYQYNPHGPFHGTIHWGHATSPDLVHWTHLPIALAPTPGGPDADGCWSGCAIDNDGVPTFMYTGVRNGEQRSCLATSDDDLLTWTKHPANPLIDGPPAELDVISRNEFRDHSVWKEGDSWYQVIGTGLRDGNGAILLYQSPDLIAWEYVRPLYISNQQQIDPNGTGTICECPDFFALGDRHTLIYSFWQHHNLFYPIYFTGRYQDHVFNPESEGVVDLGRSFYAPQSFTDAHGRRIMFGWLREEWSNEAQRAAGWSGVMSLPRVLTLLPDGVLGMDPAPEVEALRGSHREWSGDALPATGALVDGVKGANLEIVAEWERGIADVVGIDVRCSPDRAEVTGIRYNYNEQRLFVDRSHASLSEDGNREECGGTLALAEGEPLRLRVFLDGSVIEVFANGRACLSTRVYPSRPDSLGLALFASGDTPRVTHLDIWELAV